MTPAAKQAHYVALWRVIEDPQERLAALVARARKLPALPMEARTEENLVQGCSSRVWLVSAMEETGACRFHLEADSALVKGLAACLCEVYDGLTPAAAAGFESTVLEELGLFRQLSPSRAHGLLQVQRAIREFAQREVARRS